MSSIKFKPLSEHPTHIQVVDANGEVLEDRDLKLGEYVDLTIPPGGKIILTES